MKKLTTLVLAAGLVVSAFAGSASAGEFKPNAQFAEEFVYGDAGHGSPENFNAATRVRFGFDYIASEDLSATILFQYRDMQWGSYDGFDGDPTLGGTEEAQFRLRLAYIDWTIPGTEIKVRMGRQPVVAPSYAFGSAILDGRGDAISFNSNVNENIALGFTWLRLDSETRGSKAIKDANGNTIGWNRDDTADALMLNAEFAYDGFKVAPWIMYGSKQKDARMSYFEDAHAADAYAIGISGEISMFDPFVFALDAMYQNVALHNVTAPAEDSFDSFYIAAKGSYKLSNGTLGLGAWYATGNDVDNNDNASFVLDGGFSATSIMFDGNIVGVDGYTNQSGNDSPFGTWGIIAEYAGFSFVDKLSHTAKIAYIEGTNEVKNGVEADFENGLNEDQSVVEINFDTTYEIYKNFSATLQLGYAIIDDDRQGEDPDDIFRSALAFVYKF